MKAITMTSVSIVEFPPHLLLFPTPFNFREISPILATISMPFSVYGNCCCVVSQHWGLCSILPPILCRQQENFLLIYSSNSFNDVRILELPII